MASSHMLSELDDVERECQATLAALELPDLPPLDYPPRKRRRSPSPDLDRRRSSTAETSRSGRLGSGSQPKPDRRRATCSPSGSDRRAPSRQVEDGPKRTTQRTLQDRLAKGSRRLPSLDSNILAALPLTPGKLLTLSTGETVDPCTLVLPDVDPKFSCQDLETHYAQFGRVLRAQVLQRGQSARRWGIVTLSDPYEALAAKEAMDRKVLGRVLCRVEYSKKESFALTKKPLSSASEPPATATSTPSNFISTTTVQSTSAAPLMRLKRPREEEDEPILVVVPPPRRTATEGLQIKGRGAATGRSSAPPPPLSPQPPPAMPKAMRRDLMATSMTGGVGGAGPT